MTATLSTPCPRCGATVRGAFCSQCGLPLNRPCPWCATRLSAGAKFCPACGLPVAGLTRPTWSPTPATSRVPWLVTGVLTVLAITAVVYATRAHQEPVAPRTPAAAGTPPNLSMMTPKQQFDRLNDRVAAAAEAGDSATAVAFWPMAANAYDRLPPGDRDVDARFHMAWLHVLVGEYPAALALADTINTTSPGNLFGYYLRAAVATGQGDSAEAKTEHAAFKSHYDAEIRKTDRQEYVDHRALLDEFFKAP